MKVKLITLGILCAILLLGCAGLLFGNTEISVSERRPLAQWEDLEGTKLSNGTFMSKTESITMDQFPLRDWFRRLKAGFQYKLMGQKDNNGIYFQDENVGRLDYPLNELSVKYILSKINHISDTYLAGTNTNVYYCIVPDKNFYMAQELGYPTLDYDKLISMMDEGLDMDKIEIFDLLSADSYYKTDPHWDQAALQPVAEHLVTSMGTAFSLKGVELKENGTLTGAYLGQSALPLAPDTLQYWEGGILGPWRATDMTTNRRIPVYDLNGLAGDDPYDFFLGGAAPLQVIENPKSATDKELIIFRDSFGSSIAPLFSGSYRKVTLVDTRYINSNLLGNYLKFTNQDVLFLYSTGIINESSGLM